MDRWREYRIAPGRVTYPATIGVIVTMAVVFLAGLATAVSQYLWVGSSTAIRFEYWRPLLYAVTTGGLLQLAINAGVLYLMGRGLETTMGTWNFLALFVLSGLGAATALILAGPLVAYGGSFSAILGIIAAYAVFKYQARQDIRGDIVLLALLIVWGVVAGGFSLRGQWVGDVGAVVLGAGVGAVYAYSPWRSRTRRLIIGYAALTVVCLGVITLVWVGPRVS